VGWDRRAEALLHAVVERSWDFGRSLFEAFFGTIVFVNKRSLRPTRALMRTRARLTAIGMTNFGKGNDDEFLVDDKQKVPHSYFER
jgi:hypothetical protein